MTDRTPLRWDAPMARAAAAELHRELAGARLRAVRLDRSSRDLVLLFDGRALLWRLHPQRGHVVWAPPQPIGEDDLRAGGRVREVRAPADERLVRFDALPGRRRDPVSVVVELLGNQWNAVVLGAGDRVRALLAPVRGRRSLRAGQVYAPPPPSERIGADGKLDEVRWREVVEAGGEEERARRLVAALAWTSPLNAAHILAGDDPARRLARWRAVASGGAGGPVVVDLPRGPQPYPFPLPPFPSRPAATLLEAVAAWARGAGDAEADGLAALAPAWREALEAALEDARRDVGALRRALDALEDPERLRAVGDLVLARYGDLPRGTADVTLTDFDGTPVTLRLDPALAPHENAEVWYRRAARTRRAAATLPPRLAAARRRLARLEELARRAALGEAAPEELAALATTGTGRSRTASAPRALPYRTYRSSGGLEIRVGRGARNNDRLTLRHARSDDIWLHAQQAAGAHVILVWGRREDPPARDLEEAAVLAALHSRARGSATVPVSWTRRKWVRKPRGAPAGQVVPDRARTLFVHPDAALEERLRTE